MGQQLKVSVALDFENTCSGWIIFKLLVVFFFPKQLLKDEDRIWRLVQASIAVQLHPQSAEAREGKTIERDQH